MKILSINCGSSSLKFQMYEMPEEKVLISGVFERIGSENSFYTLKLNGEKIKKETPILEHSKAVDILIKELFNYDIVESLDEIKGVGHRVVHGGEKYSKSVLIDDDVMNTIEELIPLAPLHNPANLMGIKAFEKDIPNAKQVAVFDTAFPESMPEESYMFTAPYEWYTKYGLRHYGFHGISHNYVVDYMKKELNKENINMINCHLGNGSTAACIKDGVCFDTTLGFSTNSGLMMGTRSGDIDPYIIPYIIPLLLPINSPIKSANITTILGITPAILNQLKKLACKKYIIKNIKHKLTIDITFFRLFTSLINLF